MFGVFLICFTLMGLGYCIRIFVEEIQAARQFPKFKPGIFYNDTLRLTELVLEDTGTTWYSWGPYKGHAVDCGYAWDDGRLVGIKIWDDVRKRPVRDVEAVEKQLGVDGVLSLSGEHGPECPL